MLWYKVMVEGVREHSFDLSARQMALILRVYLQDGPHTVRGLSENLDVSKPAICRAIDSLEKQHLIARSKDEDDKRNVFIIPTATGYSFLSAFSESILNNLMAIQ